MSNEKSKQPTLNSKADRTSVARLRQQIEELERRCDDAEEALNAIRRGAVDALVIYTDEGEKIFTIQGGETTYRLMIESINEGAATLIEDGTILYCNRRFADMLATPLEAIIGSSIYQFFEPDDQPAISKLLLRGINEKCRSEANFIRRDGLRLPVMLSLNNFSSISALGVCLVATDLTESKKAEAVIRRDALRAETMSEITRLLTEASLDEAAIMKVVTESAARLVGDASILRVLAQDQQSLRTVAHYHPDPHVSQLIEDIITYENLPADKGISGSVLRTGEVMRIPELNPYYSKKIIREEFPGLREQIKLYGLLVVPIRAHEHTIGTLELVDLTRGKPYILEDQHVIQRIADHMAIALTNAQLYSDLEKALRTEQTMREQLIQAEKLSALNRMMATVVHEINNPVQTIKNCLYLAEDEVQPGTPEQDYLAMASSEIDRISKLVASLREIYRQPKPMTSQTLEISQILADVHMLLEPHLEHHKIIWQQEPAKDPLWVNAIIDHLKQVFLNISLNAIDAMQPDGGTLTVSTSLDSEKNEVAVIISDTGCGIEKENLTKIFEPFFTTKEAGSGLGLSICYEIMQQHSGRITVESEPGKGSTFSVWLPQVATPEI